MVLVTRKIRNHSLYTLVEQGGASYITAMRCRVCKQMLALETFEKNTRRWHGMQEICLPCRRADYWSAENTPLREKKKVTLLQRYQDNKDEHNRKVKAYAEAHPEIVKKAKANYRKRNKQVLREKNLAYYYQERATNPEKLNARNKNQRAKRRGVPGHISKQEWSDRLAEFNDCCAYCLIPLVKDTRSQDHMISVKNKGWHVIENVIPCCRSCNSKKQFRSIIQWVAADPQDAIPHGRCQPLDTPFPL